MLKTLNAWRDILFQPTGQHWFLSVCKASSFICSHVFEDEIKLLNQFLWLHSDFYFLLKKFEFVISQWSLLLTLFKVSMCHVIIKTLDKLLLRCKMKQQVGSVQPIVVDGSKSTPLDRNLRFVRFTSCWIVCNQRRATVHGKFAYIVARKDVNLRKLPGATNFMRTLGFT